MKKRIITLLMLLCLVITGIPSAKADDDWYTYTYNFWGDETASPDAYSVTNVFYGRNFGEEVGTFNDPEGMFVIDDLVYIADTANNRIVELQYINGSFELVRIIYTLQVSVKTQEMMRVYEQVADPIEGNENHKKWVPGEITLTLKSPYDIHVVKMDEKKREKMYGTSHIGELYVPPVPEPDEKEDGTDKTDDTDKTEDADKSATTSDSEDASDGDAATEEPGETNEGEGKDEPAKEPEKKLENVVKKELDRDYDIFIADFDNYRIIHCDYNLNVIGVVQQPKDETLDDQYVFFPSKFVVDDVGRYYVQAKNINSGLMEFNKAGEFTTYVGASPVTLSIVQRLWRRIQTKEQRKRTKQYVPTEYNNVALDPDGFLYVTTATLKEDEYIAKTAKPVRKLNAMGQDILIRNGNQSPIGDLAPGTAENIKGYSAFVDVVIFENETYCCLDRTRGKVFCYDFQGNMLYAFGNYGMNAGSFAYPSAIDKLDEQTFIVLDRKCGTLTIFEMSDFGKLIKEALDLYRVGQYDKSADVWTEVLKYNGNYDLAYVGVGRALLRQEKYKDAMDKFEVVRDGVNYSKAFKHYREEQVEEHIVLFLGILIALIVIPKLIRKVIRLRKEIKEA